MLTSTAPVLVAGRFAPLLQELLALLSGLSEADWARPTAAAVWSVKDVALHLLGDELGNLSARRDRFFEPGPNREGWGDLVAWIDRRNQAWVEATRRLSPRMLIDLLRLTGAQANAYFTGLDPFALGGGVSWAGPDPAPVWLDVAREFTERWHHQQHIREAVGAPVLDDPGYLGPVLATYVHALPRAYRAVEAAEGMAVTLVIEGPAGGDWTVVRESGAWRLYAGQSERPAAVAALAQDAAWRLFTRGLSPGQARAAARLSGELELVGPILSAVAIIA